MGFSASLVRERSSARLIRTRKENTTIDWLQTALLLLILAFLVGLRKSSPTGDDRGGVRDEMSRLGTRLDAMTGALDEIKDRLGVYEKDQEILDELQANVMTEWARIIEEELGKRPVKVPCPSCDYEGGLEPNLLADEDTEYGCPNCGAIASIDSLRERYPNAGL